MLEILLNRMSNWVIVATDCFEAKEKNMTLETHEINGQANHGECNFHTFI